MQDNKKVLDSLNNGCKMAMDSIKFIIQADVNSDIKKELESEYKEYEKINKKVDKYYLKYNFNEQEIKNPSLVTKMMLFYDIKMKRAFDRSNSKVAELMLKGTNMGIIEGRKLLNNKNVDKKLNQLLNDFVVMQEKNIENLKKYL